VRLVITGRKNKKEISFKKKGDSILLTVKLEGGKKKNEHSGKTDGGGKKASGKRGPM